MIAQSPNRPIAHPLLSDGPAMRPIKFIRENPITVMCVAVLALIGWVAVDLAKTGPKKQTAELSTSADDESSNPGDAITFAINPDDPGHFYYKDDGFVGQVSLDHVAVTTAANDADLAGIIDPDWPHSWWSIRPPVA